MHEILEKNRDHAAAGCERIRTVLSAVADMKQTFNT